MQVARTRFCVAVLLFLAAIPFAGSEEGVSAARWNELKVKIDRFNAEDAEKEQRTQRRQSKVERFNTENKEETREHGGTQNPRSPSQSRPLREIFAWHVSAAIFLGFGKTSQILQRVLRVCTALVPKAFPPSTKVPLPQIGTPRENSFINGILGISLGAWRTTAKDHGATNKGFSRSHKFRNSNGRSAGWRSTETGIRGRRTLTR